MSAILATLPEVTAADLAALAPAPTKRPDSTRTDAARAATIERRHARAMKRGTPATRAGRRAAKRD